MDQINADFIEQVQKNDLILVADSLRRGANVHFECDLALRTSAAHENVEMVSLLLNNGADTSANCLHGLSTFGHAIVNGHTKIVKMLLEHDANIKKEIALHYCAMNGYAEIATILLQNGADVHTDDDLPLRSSVSGNHFEVAIVLLKAGANVNTHDDVSLRTSIVRGNLALVAKLLEYGAKSQNRNVFRSLDFWVPTYTV